MPEGQSAGALRIIGSYDGASVQLVAVERVDMTVFASDDLGPVEGSGGFRYELQDEHGAVLYRRFIRNPMPRWVEVPTGDETDPLAYLETDVARGHFMMLAPDLEEASFLVVHGPLAELTGPPMSGQEEPREIVRFRLGDPVDPNGPEEPTPRGPVAPRI